MTHYETDTDLAPFGKKNRKIVTERFTLGSSIHARYAIMHRAAGLAIATALPVAALIVCGSLYDTRLWFIAAVIMFILVPTMLFIGWYGILTRPWAIASIYPQQVKLAVDDELTVEYSRSERYDSTPDDLVIPRSTINDCRLWNNYIIVIYSYRRELIIPLSAFSSRDDVTSFISRLESLRDDE